MGYWFPGGSIEYKTIGFKTCALENIKILVEAGADMNCQDGDDCTALGCLLGQILRKGACEWNGLEEMDKDLPLVDMMVDAGADKQAKFGAADRTPLEYGIHFVQYRRAAPERGEKYWYIWKLRKYLGQYPCVVQSPDSACYRWICQRPDVQKKQMKFNIKTF